MTTDLQPYPAYKPSGIDWLGDVPTHWDVRRLKTVCRLAYGDTLTASMRNFGSVPVYGSNGQVGVHSEANTMSPCIVVGRKGSFGKVNYVEQPAFAIDTTYFVDKRYSQNNLRWLFYLLGWLRLDDVTRDSAVPGLGREDAYGRLAPVPPLAEQAAIARYLDRADERIRRAIDAKRRLVELLTEQRQAVIHRAVTRGLDEGVAMKPSGVEWLGDVPAHWDVRRLGYLASKFGSGITPRGGATVYQDTGIPFLRSQNIHFDGLRLKEVAHISESLHNELSGSHVKPDDVLLNITGASIGRVCSVSEDFTEGNVNQHVCIIRPRKEYILSGFLSSYLSTPMMQHEIYVSQSGASREGLTLEAIRGFRIALPPLAEQAAIARHLDKATGDIDAAIANAERQEALLGEYRARLVADVVCGRVDVRDTLTVSSF